VLMWRWARFCQRKTYRTEGINEIAGPGTPGPHSVLPPIYVIRSFSRLFPQRIHRRRRRAV